MDKILAEFTIPLDPRTKKNHQTIAGSGSRCPYCKKFQRLFVRQGKAHDEYAKKARAYLVPIPKEPISQPIHIRYTFYMQTHRRVDESNLIECVDDLLQDNGIISDDKSAVLIHHDGTRVLYDKEHPRTEVTIYEYRKESDEYAVAEDVHG